jgi:hypothetical protein
MRVTCKASLAGDLDAKDIAGLISTGSCPGRHTAQRPEDCIWRVSWCAPPPEVQLRRTRARPPERRSRATRLDELAQQLLPMQRPSGTAPEGSPLLSSGVSRSSVEAPIFWSVGARTQQRRGSTSPPSYGNTQAPVYESAWLASVSLAVQIAICQKPRTTVTARDWPRARPSS